MVVVKWRFSNSIKLSIYIYQLAFYCASFPFPSCLHSCQHQLMDSYFILQVITHSYQTVFYFTHYTDFLCPSDMFPIFLEIPGTVRYSRLFLFFPCPSPRISHFTRELSSDSFQQITVFRNQDLDGKLLGYHCFQALSTDRTRKYEYVQTTHTHFNICFYFYQNIYQNL